MVYENTEKQKELFEEFQPGKKGFDFLKGNNNLVQNKIFMLRFSVEKLIFISIAMVVLVVIVFCIGVERGKNKARPVLPAQVMQNAEPADISAPVTNINLGTPLKGVSTLGKGAVYKIHLATYVGKESAHRQMLKVKESGFPAYIKASSKFFLLCIGDYPDRQQAEGVLAQVRKKYKDCYIKTTKK